MGMATCRQEAKRIPDVVTSEIDPRRFDGQRTAAVPLEAHSAEYNIPQTAFTKALLEFLDVRLKLQQYVHASNLKSWLPLLCCLDKHKDRFWLCHVYGAAATRQTKIWSSSPSSPRFWRLESLLPTAMGPASCR